VARVIARFAGWMLIVLYALLLVAIVALWLAGTVVTNSASFLIGGSVFAGVGAVLAVRRPRNAVGWLCLAFGMAGTSALSAQAYATHALVTAPATLPGGAIAAWWAGWIFTPPFLILTMFLPLLFPTGRPPSPRWRPLLWASFSCLAVGCVFAAFTPGPLAVAPQFENPFGVALLGEAPAVFAGIAFASLVALSFACLASIIVRYRNAGPTERQQLKWFTWAFGFQFLVLMLGSSLQGIFKVAVPQLWWDLVWPISVTAIPIAIGIAVLRYRLYDIDVLINRTLVYGVTTAGIAATFFAGVVVLQSLLRPFTGGSEIAVAASTLLTVALFQPLRSRIQRAVDRRFYRSRYDASRTIDAFAEELRDEVDLEAVRAHLLGAVGQTMSPAHASLWLRERTT
jgi:hypothetical protein